MKLLLTPVILLWLLLLWTAVRVHRAQSPHRRMVWLVLLLFWLGCTKPLVDLLAAPLELAAPPFANVPIQHIMVLGCTHEDSSFLPLTSQLAPCALARVSEGIRIWHQQPHALLHLSGHISQRQQPHSELARRYAIAMGVAATKIRIYPQPHNTQQETAAVLLALNGEPTAVVTSAMHMPRTLRWLHYYQRKYQTEYQRATQGLDQAKPAVLLPAQLTAAPTDFATRRPFSQLSWQSWLPSVYALPALSYALYEYAALVEQTGLMYLNQPDLAEMHFTGEPPVKPDLADQ